MRCVWKANIARNYITPKTGVFGLHFCCIQFESTNLTQLSPKITARLKLHKITTVISFTRSFKVTFLVQSKARMRLPMSEPFFPLVEEYWSQVIVVDSSVPLFNALVWHESLHSRLQHFGVKKLKAALRCAVWWYSDILNHLRVAYQCNRQTDGRTELR